MTWPAWIDELGRRYLAGEGNVFLLHGDTDAEWPHEGTTLGVVELLTRFLARTRAVVGHVSSDRGIVFPELGDQNTFERILGAQNILAGRTNVLSSRIPTEALARVYRAAGDPALAQAYLVLDPAEVYPATRKRVEPLPEDTPWFSGWNERLGTTNNLVLLLVRRPSDLHPTVRGDLPAIAMDQRAPAPPQTRPTLEPPPAPETPRAAPAEAATGASARPPAPTAGPGPADLLPAALERAFLGHDTSTWESKLPVLAAVAEVIHQLAPDRCGPLRFHLDDDGKPAADGPGADWFLAAWRKDIALDASAGMMVRELQHAPGGGVTVDATSLRALSRRTAKLLTRA